jgi:histidinol-phosphate aminotransferase
MADFIRPAIKNLPLRPANWPAHQHKLNQNENPLDYPADLKAEVLRRMAELDWGRYPSLWPTELQAKLAAQAHVEPEMILVGNGSTDLIRLILMSALTPGDTVVIPSPTFIDYKLVSSMFGAIIHEVPLQADDHFALPVKSILANAAEHQAKLIVLCQPNNPTGTAYPHSEIRRLAAETEALVLIDEAYCEFNEEDCLALPAEFDNVILVRTFSKAWAMAGLRVGYAIAPTALATNLRRGHTAFTPNLFGQTATLVALENRHRFQSAVDLLKHERQRLFNVLNRLPNIYIYPSSTNFLLIRTPYPSSDVCRCLLDQAGLLITDVSHYPGLDHHVRISIGTPAENDLVIAAFTQLMYADETVKQIR